ncbi:MAG: hypothetical protein H0W62_02875 [Chitinophagales bacterium]|nr:hypothetical protein [Chitinophagales bacterium]
MKQFSYTSAQWVLVILTAIETACASYFTKNNVAYIPLTSIVYFLSGLMIGLIPLHRFAAVLHNPKSLYIQIHRIAIIVFFCFGMYYLIPHVYWVFSWIKIDYHAADMIPQIQVACQRFFFGEKVYAPMPEVWGMLPTYLPMMWLPYLPIYLTGGDVRWTSVYFFIAAIALLLWMLGSLKKINWGQLLLILVCIGNLIFIQTDYNRNFFAWTEEGVVVGYYILLGFGLSKKRPFLTGIAITCCLLSRYSLFFWIPAYLIYQYFSGRRNHAIIEAVIITFLTTILFIIPYFSTNATYFLHLPQNYSNVIKQIWLHSYDQIEKSLGFAKFFQVSQVTWLHTFDIFLAAAVPVIFYSILYLKRKSNKINFTFSGLCGLKLTLTFFYNFLEAPFFSYLYIVPTLFSYVILFHFLNSESQQLIKDV